MYDLPDKKYPRPDEIKDGFLIANTTYIEYRCKLVQVMLFVVY
ncbi:hypothetical protein [Campylobacter concisus]|nr:hypothetical protein [Campylobacter concisus]